MLNFKGKAVIITGGLRGIGYALKWYFGILSVTLNNYQLTYA